jgi:pyridoxal phosphate-dependent aminotransferase EpsN
MLVSDEEDLITRARKLASQAREPAVHYEHTEVGYNYRFSNILAALGRGQLRVLPQRVEARRANFVRYQQGLGDLPGLTFQPEAAWGTHSRWATCLRIEPSTFGADRERIREALEAANIESRPVWKPMHQQPAFRGAPVHGGAVADALFDQGLCLPSGSNLTAPDLDRVITIVRGLCAPAG